MSKLLSLNYAAGGSSKGASMVEFAISLPIILVVVLMFTDLARYLAVQGALNVGAQEALGIATTIEGLDDDDPESEAKKSAVSRIMQAAKRFPVATFVSTSDQAMAYINLVNIAEGEYAQLTLPSPPAGISMEQALKDHPIEIELTGVVKPFLFFLPPFPVSAKAVGYREQRRIATLPVKTDCSGNPLGSSSYGDLSCLCPENEVWSPQQRECVCRSNLKRLEDGSCGCTGHYQLQGSGTPYVTCACVEPQGYSCPPMMRFDLYGFFRTCDCVCDWQGGLTSDGAGSCKCSNPNHQYMDSTARCECPVTCPPGQSLNLATCQCKCDTTCPFGAVQNPTDCSCECVPQRIWNGSACVCRDDLDPCTGGRVRSTSHSDCRCVCPSGQTWNSSTSSCDCTDPKKHQVNGACVCRDDLDPCPAGGPTLNPSTCNCSVCPGNQVALGDQCVCPEDTSPDPLGEDTCICNPCPPRSTQQDNCSCKCNGSLQMYQGACLDPVTCPFGPSLSHCSINASSGQCSGCIE